MNLVTLQQPFCLQFQVRVDLKGFNCGIKGILRIQTAPLGHSVCVPEYSWAVPEASSLAQALDFRIADFKPVKGSRTLTHLGVYSGKETHMEN